MPLPSAAPTATADDSLPVEHDTATEPSSNIVKDMTEILSKRLLIDIVMKLPVVVFPVSSRSTSALVMDLGGLSVANELRPVEKIVSSEGIPAIIDRTNLHWTSVRLARFYPVV